MLQEYIVMRADASEGCAVDEPTPWSRVTNADFGVLSSSITSFFLSYCTIANLDGSVPFTTTPLPLTRGSKSDSTWMKNMDSTEIKEVMSFSAMAM
jgi:hypothetical protein